MSSLSDASQTLRSSRTLSSARQDAALIQETNHIRIAHSYWSTGHGNNCDRTSAQSNIFLSHSRVEVIALVGEAVG